MTPWVTRDFFRNYFHREKDGKNISLNAAVDRNLFSRLAHESLR